MKDVAEERVVDIVGWGRHELLGVFLASILVTFGKRFQQTFHHGENVIRIRVCLGAAVHFEMQVSALVARRGSIQVFLHCPKKLLYFGRTLPFHVGESVHQDVFVVAVHHLFSRRQDRIDFLGGLEESGSGLFGPGGDTVGIQVNVGVWGKCGSNVQTVKRACALNEARKRDLVVLLNPLELVVDPDPGRFADLVILLLQ